MKKLKGVGNADVLYRLEIKLHRKCFSRKEIRRNEWEEKLFVMFI